MGSHSQPAQQSGENWPTDLIVSARFSAEQSMKKQNHE
jgi:hypothetical protein